MEFFYLSESTSTAAAYIADEHLNQTANSMIRRCVAAQRRLITEARVVHMEQMMKVGSSTIQMKNIDELEKNLDNWLGQPLDDDPVAWIVSSNFAWSWASSFIRDTIYELQARFHVNNSWKKIASTLIVDGIEPVQVGRRGHHNPPNVLEERARYVRKYYGKVHWKWRGAPAWFNEDVFVSLKTSGRITP